MPDEGAYAQHRARQKVDAKNEKEKPPPKPKLVGSDEKKKKDK